MSKGSVIEFILLGLILLGNSMPRRIKKKNKDKKEKGEKNEEK